MTGTRGVVAEELYTMQQAAQRKGVCYHTVSRAVRSGRLPSQRLGRQVLIAPANLEAWQPKRERAPRKYRRAEPDLNTIASSLTQASLDRTELESTLATLATAIVNSSSGMTLEELRDAVEVLSAFAVDSGRRPEAASS